jgi:glycosyltransferase involved in cell wall biosynthesis
MTYLDRISGQHDVLFFPDRLALPKPSSSPKATIAVVGNFPPTKCGIATFTADMVNSIRETSPDSLVDVYGMVRDENIKCQKPVRTLIVETDRESYRQAGIELDRSGADIVWLQHEFGLFGGDDGAWIIDLLTPVAIPLAVTFHTILETPTEGQKRVMDWLVARAAKLVAMTEEGRMTLEHVYGADPDQIVIIPHGVPDRPFGRTEEMKEKFDFSGRNTLMTFGLISPGKGIETVIAALPGIVAQFPETRYCIAGATHPKLLAREGEKYRHDLVSMATSLGVADHIVWVNRFLDEKELLDLIEAADIYLTPYTGAGQSTSGTLSYAVALGKAVISTPYKHANELLSNDVGVIVPFADVSALQDAVASLLADPQLLASYQRKAYSAGRSMTWPVFGRKSMEVVESLRVGRPVALRTSKVASECGLLRMCDDTGILQHGVFSIPDRAHGYCIDDNARALMFANVSNAAFAQRARTFAAFIQHGWNPDIRRFRNFMGFDRTWLEQSGSDDSCGRTLWALGATMASACDTRIELWASKLWAESSDMALDFSSPRATAFAMLGADRVLETCPGDKSAQIILETGLKRLAELYAAVNRPGWRWFETYLAYDNCRLPEAMLRAAVRIGDDISAVHALEALDWIVLQQTTPAGHFRPIGSNSFGNTIVPDDPFDQQPVDAWATVDAAAAAYYFEPEQRWLDTARAAFGWFFGRNDRGIAVADLATGGCHDGLTPRGVNLNQGAESVLSLHLAQHTIMKLEAGLKEGHAAETEQSQPASV